MKRYDPNQPRDKDGQWTDGSGSPEGSYKSRETHQGTVENSLSGRVEEVTRRVDNFGTTLTFYSNGVHRSASASIGFEKSKGLGEKITSAIKKGEGVIYYTDSNSGRDSTLSISSPLKGEIRFEFGNSYSMNVQGKSKEKMRKIFKNLR